jgi:LTXXQ motif family protein
MRLSALLFPAAARSALPAGPLPHVRSAIITALAVVALAGCAQCGPPAERAERSERGGPAGGAPGQSIGLGSMPSAAAARQWLMDRSAAQLANAQRQLAIGSAQAPAWDRYSASIGQLVTDLSRFESDPVSATAMQRIDRRVDIARDRYTALENVSDSLHALYAVLSAEQRVTADRVLAGTVPSLYEGNPFAPPANEVDRRIGDAPVRRSGRTDPSR